MANAPGIREWGHGKESIFTMSNGWDRLSDAQRIGSSQTHCIAAADCCRLGLNYCLGGWGTGELCQYEDIKHIKNDEAAR